MKLMTHVPVAPLPYSVTVNEAGSEIGAPGATPLSVRNAIFGLPVSPMQSSSLIDTWPTLPVKVSVPPCGDAAALAKSIVVGETCSAAGPLGAGFTVTVTRKVAEPLTIGNWHVPTATGAIAYDCCDPFVRPSAVTFAIPLHAVAS